MNILIVDDNRSMRKLLQEIVHKIDPMIDVIVASSYEEASLLLKKYKFNGALLDLVLIKSSGISVAELCEPYNIPIVFVTSTSDDFNYSLMYKYGWIINKPILADAVVRAVTYFKQLG